MSYAIAGRDNEIKGSDLRGIRIEIAERIDRRVFNDFGAEAVSHKVEGRFAIAVLQVDEGHPRHAQYWSPGAQVHALRSAVGAGARPGDADQKAVLVVGAIVFTQRRRKSFIGHKKARRLGKLRKARA